MTTVSNIDEHRTFSLDEIQANVRKALSDNSDTIAVSVQFRALNSNAERVFFAYDILKKYKLLPDIIRVEKCDEKSEERRKYGNHVFVRLKRDHDAMKHYNKSIAYAKSNEALALAYGNRSAIYYENKLYQECIKDIEHAFENNYPEHLQNKLNERKKNAEKNMSSLNKQSEEYFTELPIINGPKNSKIECASDCIEMKHTETMGRHIITTRTIEAGDVIAIEEPYTTILLYNYYLTHCHHCLYPSYNLIPCSQCPLTLYCSESCRKNAWDRYHQYECSILDTLHSMDATKLQLIALRVVLCARNEFSNMLQLNDINVDDVYKSACYKEIHNLITNEEQRPPKDLFARSTVAAVLMHLLETTSFFEQFDGNDLNFNKKCTAELLLRHLQTAPSNMHEISELQGNEESGYEIFEIGAGAYAFMSLLNHSCAPNVVRHCYGSKMVLTALQPIEAGQQLFDNYGYHFALMDREQRRTHLKDQYWFTCECEACVKDWPLYMKIAEGNTYFVVEESELTALQHGSREMAKKLLPFLIVNAKNFELTQPKEFVKILDNQEIMKQCFAINGNKYTMF